MGWYFLIGLTYAIVNGAIRKINTDGDWLLSIVWITLWPICFIGLIFLIQDDIINKKRTKK